jgi:lysophospholipase L1-like esterase
MTRTLLLFGDSNTHGTMAMPDLGFGGRFDREERWAGRLAKLLPDWEVIAEGHPGRTTVHDDPVEGAHRNGLTVLPALLESHKPLDVVLVMLGTNDLKERFSVNACDVALSLERLVRVILGSGRGRATARRGCFWWRRRRSWRSAAWQECSRAGRRSPRRWRPRSRRRQSGWGCRSWMRGRW